MNFGNELEPDTTGSITLWLLYTSPRSRRHQAAAASHMSTFIRHKGRTHQANTKKTDTKNTKSSYNDTQYANKEKEIKTSTHSYRLESVIFAVAAATLEIITMNELFQFKTKYRFLNRQKTKYNMLLVSQFPFVYWCIMLVVLTRGASSVDVKFMFSITEQILNGKQSSLSANNNFFILPKYRRYE